MSEVKELSIFELEEGKVYTRGYDKTFLYKKRGVDIYRAINNRIPNEYILETRCHTNGYVVLEPISKPVTAEQVREAIKDVWHNNPAQPDGILLKLICEKLGLE